MRRAAIIVIIGLILTLPGLFGVADRGRAALIVMVGLVLLAPIGCWVMGLSLFAHRRFRQGRWLLGGFGVFLAVPVPVVVLVMVGDTYKIVGRALFFAVGLVLLGVVGCLAGKVGRNAWRHFREGQWLAAVLAVLVAVCVLVPLLFLMEMIGFVFYEQ